MLPIVPDLSPLTEALERRIAVVANVCPTETTYLSPFTYAVAPYLRWSRHLPTAIYALTQLKVESILAELGQTETRCGGASTFLSRYAFECDERELIYERMQIYFAEVGEVRAAQILARMGRALEKGACGQPAIEEEPTLCQVDHRVIPAVPSGYGLMEREAVYVGQVVPLGCMGPMVKTPAACPFQTAPTASGRPEVMEETSGSVHLGDEVWKFTFWHLSKEPIPDFTLLARELEPCDFPSNTLEKLDRWYAWSPVGVLEGGCDVETANRIFSKLEWGLLRYYRTNAPRVPTLHPIPPR